MHTHQNIVIQATLSDDFRLTNAREFLGPRMPFIETVIQQHMSAQLGLGAVNIATMAKKEAVAQQDPVFVYLVFRTRLLTRGIQEFVPAGLSIVADDCRIFEDARRVHPDYRIFARGAQDCLRWQQDFFFARLVLFGGVQYFCT